MTKENKDLLQKLLWQHKELGISDQIDFDKYTPGKVFARIWQGLGKLKQAI